MNSTTLLVNFTEKYPDKQHLLYICECHFPNKLLCVEPYLKTLFIESLMEKNSKHMYIYMNMHVRTYKCMWEKKMWVVHCFWACCSLILGSVFPVKTFWLPLCYTVSGGSSEQRYCPDLSFTLCSCQTSTHVCHTHCYRCLPQLHSQHLQGQDHRKRL